MYLHSTFEFVWELFPLWLLDLITEFMLLRKHLLQLRLITIKH